MGQQKRFEYQRQHDRAGHHSRVEFVNLDVMFDAGLDIPFTAAIPSISNIRSLVSGAACLREGSPPPATGRSAGGAGDRRNGTKRRAVAPRQTEDVEEDAPGASDPLRGVNSCRVNSTSTSSS